jgi:hypothetical protein
MNNCPVNGWSSTEDNSDYKVEPLVPQGDDEEDEEDD